MFRISVSFLFSKIINANICYVLMDTIMILVVNLLLQIIESVVKCSRRSPYGTPPAGGVETILKQVQDDIVQDDSRASSPFPLLPASK